MHILVTAGPTRQYIDPVRYISNASSGKMGYAAARAGILRGHKVTLVSGPVNLRAVKSARLIQVTSAAQMAQACFDLFARIDAVIMTAAVSDYTPARTSKYKLKKTAKGAKIDLVPTVDILAELGRRKKPGQILLGFALEDRAGKSNAIGKLQDKNLDAIVLNSPASIAAQTADFTIIHADRTSQRLVQCSKRRLAGRLIRLLEQFHQIDR